MSGRMSAVSFAGRVVIVTGAGGGIGRTYALDIARRGGAVVVNDLGGDVAGRHPSSSMADAVVAEIRAAGGRALASYDSVATRAGASALVAAAVREFGRIDAVINNAGIMRNCRFEDYRDEDREATLATHLGGSWLVSQAAWPQLRAQGYGRLVFTASSVGMFGTELQSAYGAAKAGVVGLMHVLAHEGREHGILCNALMPNAMGRMALQYLKDQGGDVSQLDPAQQAALGLSAEPEFNTGLAVYLASEACSSTRAIYSACLGRIARVFVGVTPGWQAARGRAPTAEDVAAHFAEIGDLRRGFYVPETPREEWAQALGKPPPLR